MELQDIRADHRHDLVELVIVGIDGDRDDLGPAADTIGEHTGIGGFDMPRALGKEDEADMGRAQRHRMIDGLRRLQSADFYVQPHEACH